MNGSEMWRSYLLAFSELTNIRLVMHAHGEDVLDSIRVSLLRGGTECSAALAYVPSLGVEQQMEILPQLTSVALVVGGSTTEARQLIVSLPNDRVREFMLKVQPEVIQRSDYEEYACLLELWMALGGESQARQLAEMAAAEDREDIRDVGALYICKLEQMQAGDFAP